jgi:hypothetical protein
MTTIYHTYSLGSFIVIVERNRLSFLNLNNKGTEGVPDVLALVYVTVEYGKCEAHAAQILTKYEVNISNVHLLQLNELNETKLVWIKENS